MTVEQLVELLLGWSIPSDLVGKPKMNAEVVLRIGEVESEAVCVVHDDGNEDGPRLVIEAGKLRPPHKA